MKYLEKLCKVDAVSGFEHRGKDDFFEIFEAFGLTPKTEGKLSNHPGRIYVLLQEKGEDDMLEFGFNLLNTYLNRDKVKEMYLLRIDLSKLKDVKFFTDPNFYMGEAAWTYQNIPPFAIEVDKKINMSH